LSSYEEKISSQHEIIFGDINKIQIDTNKRYSFMISSPPYPNMKDYYAFFFPENYALENILGIERFKFGHIRESLIGTAAVSLLKKNAEAKDFNILSSASAKKFLHNLSAWTGSQRSIRDNNTYYLPFFIYYFSMLQNAFFQIDKMLADDVDAYMIVVNNTARKYVIPVHSFVKEVWSSIGYNVMEDEEFTCERAHVGSINPRVVGFKARHMEYVLRLNRA
jgi:hypothetical protein